MRKFVTVTLVSLAMAGAVAQAGSIVDRQNLADTIVRAGGGWESNYNYGGWAAVYITSDQGDTPDTVKGLVSFDLADVEADVTSATLQMWMRDNSPDPPSEFTMTIYAGLPADEGWVESEVTWNSKAAGESWSVLGGGYDDSVSATGTWSGVGPYKSFDVTELVQVMVDNGQATGTFHVWSDQAVPWASQARWSTKERLEWMVGGEALAYSLLSVESEGVVCTPHIGDANEDGEVGIADLSALADNYGATGATWRMGNFNDDDEVGIADLSALADNYGWTGDPCTGQTVPEPMTLALLAAGALIALRRRA